LLVSYSPSKETYFDETPSPWLKAYMPGSSEGVESISTRYEHTAVISKEGVLAVWGGTFQDTSDVKGIWMINIAGKDSTINLSMAEADAILLDYERELTALHTIIIMMMFMSMSLTLLLGLTQRYQELVVQSNDDAAVAAGIALAAQDFGNNSPPSRRGRGLHPEIIDTIPRKIYSTNDNDGGDEEEQCCAICLVDYTEGDELRVLPCGHYMHKSCVDAWLFNNPSCPNCRYSLRELVDDQPLLLRTLRSRLTGNSALARFLVRNDTAQGIEMTESSHPRDETVFDLRYVSSLDLTEEDTATESRRGGSTDDPDPLTRTVMYEIGSWRGRRRQQPPLEQGRTRRERFRRRDRHRRSRVPLADLDVVT